jgi:hypothetical protein
MVLVVFWFFPWLNAIGKDVGIISGTQQQAFLLLPVR